MTPDEATELAAKIVAERFPDAEAAFVAGSIIRGEGTVLSDIDLVVLHTRLDHAWRESFLFDGTPVEAFVHDPETLNWFFSADLKTARPALVGMVAEGRVVGMRPGFAHGLKQRAQAMLAEGPPPIAQEQLDQLRYTITDKIDDLRGERSAEEIFAIGSALYAPLAEILLRARGSWIGAAKWLPRLLRKADPRLADRFTSAFQRLYGSLEADELISLADHALAPYGGRLFDGDRRAAAATARLALD